MLVDSPVSTARPDYLPCVFFSTTVVLSYLYALDSAPEALCQGSSIAGQTAERFEAKITDPNVTGYPKERIGASARCVNSYQRR